MVLDVMPGAQTPYYYIGEGHRELFVGNWRVAWVADNWIERRLQCPFVMVRFGSSGRFLFALSVGLGERAHVFVHCGSVGLDLHLRLVLPGESRYRWKCHILERVLLHDGFARDCSHVPWGFLS